MSIRVKVMGAAKLAQKLVKLDAELRETIRLEVKRSALNIQSGARRRSPVDTGRLRNSITHETTPDGLSAQVGTNVEYAPFQEFGTRRAAARPFLFPAFEEERPRFQERLKKALKDASARVAR